MSKLALSLLVVLACVEHVDAIVGEPPSVIEESATTEWIPMWEVAHFAMAIRISQMLRGADRLDITEAMLHDVVAARLREHDISLASYSPGSPMPHLLVTLHVLAFQPRDHHPGVAFVLILNVMDPVILDCPGQGYVLALIWQRGNVGFALLHNYPEAVQSSLSTLAEEFSLAYLEASAAVPHSRYTERLANQYVCVMN